MSKIYISSYFLPPSIVEHDIQDIIREFARRNTVPEYSLVKSAFSCPGVVCINPMILVIFEPIYTCFFAIVFVFQAYMNLCLIINMSD